MLQSMVSERIRHNLATEQHQQCGWTYTVTLSEGSHIKELLHAITYMWNIKNQISIIQWKQTHRYREHTGGMHWRKGCGGWERYEKRIKRYKLLILGIK